MKTRRLKDFVLPPSKAAQISSNALCQIPDGRLEGVGYGLNGEQGWIFHTALNATQKSPVHVGLGSKGFLRQLLFPPQLSDSQTKLLGNIMTHWPDSSGALAVRRK